MILKDKKDWRDDTFIQVASGIIELNEVKCDGGYYA